MSAAGGPVLPEPALLIVQKLTKLYAVKRGLWRDHELVHAVDGVTFYVRPRETFGLVGESGCGKSTLAWCILRLTEPTVGRVIFDRKEITALAAAELRAMRRRMQIVFQSPYASLDPNMTVCEAVGEGIDIFRLAGSRGEARDQVTAMLERVGLGPEFASRYPHELSGGQRQRVAIARALAVRPDFVVLDEPLSALDPSVQAQVINLLDDLQEQLGLTFLLISHDLRVVRYTSHRLGVMVSGKLVEIGPAASVVRHRHHPYTRALFGALPRPNRAAAPGEASPPLEPGLRGAAATSPERPPGCVFYARCPRAERGRCDAQDPAFSELEGGSHHRVACFHPHEE